MSNSSTITSFLKDYLESIKLYNLSDQEKRQLSFGLHTFISQKLFRKKFRKQKMHPDMIANITHKVEVSVNQNIPLRFVIPFGGYKHFWNPSHPEPDWAELFTLHTLAAWLSPILAVYEPGAIIEFISEDMIVPMMNNYPEETQDQYTKIFSELLKLYGKMIPKNLYFEFCRVGDKFDKKRMIEEVEKQLPASWKKWNTFTKEQKELELHRSRRSVMWNGNEDLTKLTDQDKEHRIIESRLIELAYYTVEARSDFLGNYFLSENHIPICFSFGLSPDNIDHWIVLGSTLNSIVDFWIGRGVIEDHGSTYVPRIVSHHQYDDIKPKLRVENVDIFPFKNFQTVDIYPGVLNF